MILVASCPSGNISNFLVNYARGNTALSVTIAAFSMLGSIVFTPFNLSFWGELQPDTRPILQAVALSPLGGARHDRRAARRADRARHVGGAPLPGVRRARARGRSACCRSAFFVLFVVGALVVNWDFFLQYVAARGAVRVPAERVRAADRLLHGAGAPACRRRDRRAVSLEVGIQNSGFGLALVFNFFGGLGGMAIVAAWWGIWHIVVGLTVATLVAPPSAASPREPSHERHGASGHRRGRLPRQRAACESLAQRAGAPAIRPASSRATCARCRRSGACPASSTCARRARRRHSPRSWPRHAHRHRRAPRRHRHARRRSRTANSSTRWTCSARATCSRPASRPACARSSSPRAARPTAITPTTRSGSPRTTRSAATRRSRTRTTSAWSRRCWPSTGARSPQLRQVVFRVGTILGETTRNQITALFDRPRLIAIRGSRSPFVFIWDRTWSGAIEHAIFDGPAGIYNVAGDGALSIQEIAARLGKRCITLPPRPAARRARGAASARPVALRPGAGRLPALSSGARQPPAEGGVRLRAAHDLGRGVRAATAGARPRAGLSHDAARRSPAPTVVVSGAGGGLGRALALRFAAAGARIVALDRDAAGARSAAARAASARTRSASPCPATSPTPRPAPRPSPTAIARFGAHRRAGQQRRHHAIAAPSPPPTSR